MRCRPPPTPNTDCPWLNTPRSPSQSRTTGSGTPKLTCPSSAQPGPAYATGYSLTAPALLGAKTALENLRTRITVDSRDWAADQTLWAIADQHNIPTDQTMQAGQHRWWIANAIKAAHQIEGTHIVTDDQQTPPRAS
ncbi:hypothetical protein GTY54_06785 [Streptomyces sp. SID625]|nr:hypothetical protein [Streptomyces sp. SID625]